MKKPSQKRQMLKLSDVLKRRGKPRKPQSQEEMILQVRFANWLNKMEIVYCASGKSFSHKATAGKMKAMGYKKGFPDIFIYEPRGGYYGLAIELKSKTGVVSDEQKEWQQALIVRGYMAIIMPTGLNMFEGLDWLKKKTSIYLGV